MIGEDRGMIGKERGRILGEAVGAEAFVRAGS